MKNLKILLIILITVAITSYTVTTDWTLKSTSGCMSILNDIGEVVINSDGGLTYHITGLELSLRELKAIDKLDVIMIVATDTEGHPVFIEVHQE